MTWMCICECARMCVCVCVCVCDVHVSMHMCIVYYCVSQLVVQELLWNFGFNPE